MGEQVTMWSVREATTKGKISEVVGTPERGWGGRAGFRPLDNRWATWLVGVDVTRTQEEAEALARVNVAKRKASLEKSLAKISKNPFAAA